MTIEQIKQEIAFLKEQLNYVEDDDAREEIAEQISSLENWIGDIECCQNEIDYLNGN